MDHAGAVPTSFPAPPPPPAHWPGPDSRALATRRRACSTVDDPRHGARRRPLAVAGAAQAQDWKAKYPELTLAVVPAENASGVTERYEPFVEYLSKELGAKVTLRVANDYAAVIEGQRAGNIQIADYGPASYARAVVTGVKVEPFATTVNNDGTIGYYSVFYVRADSPYKTIDDLKGKNLGLVDPNSTSGNNVPRFVLNKLQDRAGDLLRAGHLHRQPRERRVWRCSRRPSTSPPTGGTPRTIRT